MGPTEVNFFDFLEGMRFDELNEVFLLEGATHEGKFFEVGETETDQDGLEDLVGVDPFQADFGEIDQIIGFEDQMAVFEIFGELKFKHFEEYWVFE